MPEFYSAPRLPAAMADFVIPDFISDPPVVAHGDYFAPFRWLEHLGCRAVPPRPGLTGQRPVWIRQLAEALNSAPERIESVLKESSFRRWLNRELLVLEPVPHEADARAQFVRLATLKHRYSRRFDNGRFLHLFAYSPPGEQFDWPDLPERPGYNRLKGEVPRWERTWRTLVDRNPALELLELMDEAAQTDSWAYACNGWPIGYEFAFHEWITGGSHEPPPFAQYVPDGLYKRLCRLQPQVGGWWYWKAEVGAIVWVTDSEWKTVAASWTYGR
jgi:hypothetical protein